LFPLCRSTSDASTPGSLRSLRDNGANHRLLFRPRGFSPPRRFAPRRCCGFVAPRYRLWGSLRFPVPGPSALGDGIEPPVSRNALTLRRVPLVNSRSASLRSLPPCRFRPSFPVSRAPRPKMKCRGETPDDRVAGLPRGRRMTEATVAGNRSPRNPQGYLPRRPRPVRNPRRPKPAGPLSVCVESRFHRGGRLSDRQSGRLVPSRPDSSPAEAGPGGRGSLPPFGGCRSIHRGSTGGAENRGACRSRSGSPRMSGACLRRSGASGRACGVDRNRHRVARGTMGSRLPKQEGIIGTVPSSPCRSRSMPFRSLPERTAETVVGASQAEAGSVPPRWCRSRKDRVQGLDEAPIRRSGPPHHRDDPGLERCGRRLPKQSLPFPFARRSSWSPPVVPVARYQVRKPSGGAANFEALLR
jgi:hypothetical protein